MEEETTSSKKTSTTSISSYHWICPRNDLQKGGREREKASKIAVKALYSTQKGHKQIEKILDLSFLNQFIKYTTFKVLTLNVGKTLLLQDHFTTSIDLKDG